VLTASPSSRQKSSLAVLPLARRPPAAPVLWRTWCALVAAFALLSLFGDLWQAGHLLLTNHVRCPYDGALVHEDELPAGTRSRQARPFARGPLPVSAVPQHEHHDCGVLGAAHRFSAAIVSGRGALERPEASESCLRLAPEFATKRSVLTYAPKLSPPV
jgi:hypothetical protein